MLSIQLLRHQISGIVCCHGSFRSWVFSFYCSQKYLDSLYLMAPLSLQRANPRAAAASVQIRNVIFVSWPWSCVGQPDDLTCTAYHAVVLWLSTTQRHHFLCRRPSCQGMLADAKASFRSRASRFRACSCVCIGESISRHDALIVLQQVSPIQCACSRCRPIRFRRVGSAHVAFPTARLHALQATAIAGRSDARYANLC